MAHDKPEPKAHKHHEHKPGLAFVRAGGQLVNLAHVVSVDLPEGGDPKKPLMMKLVTGTNLSLTGEDAEAVLEALGECCDVEPAKPKKPEKVEKPEKPE